MLLLKEIQLKNFLSHANTKLVFSSRQQILIDGKSGSGKSSILEGLNWCLYGKGRSDNRSLIRRGTTAAEVIVILEDINPTKAEILYQIRRNINSKGKHILEIGECRQIDNGKFKPLPIVGTRSLQEHLEKNILRSSYLLFINSVYYPQDNAENFIKQTAANRKEILLEIVRAADYEEYYKKTCNKSNELWLVVNEEEYRKITLDKELEENKLNSVNLDQYENTDKTLREEIKKLESLLLENKNAQLEQHRLITDIDVKSKEIQQLQLLAVNLDQEIKQTEDELKGLENLIIDPDALKIKLDELEIKKKQLLNLEQKRDALYQWNEKFNQLNYYAPSPVLVVRLENEILQLEVHKQTLAATPIEVCQPETGKPCPLIKIKIDQQIEEIEKKRQGLNKELQEELMKQKDYQDKVKVLGEKPKVDLIELELSRKELIGYEQLQKDYQKFKSQDEEKNKLIAHNQLLSEEKEKTKNQLEEINKEIIELRSKFILPSLQQEETNLTNRQIIIREQAENNLILLSVARQAAIKVKEIEKELKDLIKETKEKEKDLECLELLKSAFNSTGISAMIVDYVIPQLEERINNILSQLSDFRVRLDTQTTGVTGEKTIEGLFITVYNELGEEFSLDNYSGGERLKIMVAISEGLSEIQNMGFRILDETFIGLDEESTEGFIRVLDTLKTRFNQLVCVSHLRNIKDLFTERINIVKRDGISRIEGNSVI